MKRKVRVIFADDHKLLRAGFVDYARSSGDIDVVYDTDNAIDALDAYKKYKPDVLVLDIHFSHSITGYEAAIRLWAQDTHANIVFLSQENNIQTIKKIYKAGARSFISKNTDPDELVRAIKLAAVGEQYFSHTISQQIARDQLKKTNNPSELLNDKEIEIFRLTAKGYKSSEIASMVHTSTKTVSNYRRKIKEKLNIDKPSEFTRLGMEYKVIN
jgi:DNA-binding NarL/FixJ family response regulator